VKFARKLREHLHEVLAAAHSGQPMPVIDLDAIAEVIQAAHAARVLVAPASTGLASHRWASPLAPDVPLHACTLAIERLLVDVDRNSIENAAHPIAMSTTSIRARVAGGSGVA
jgi:hypothetical protein